MTEVVADGSPRRGGRGENDRDGTEANSTEELELGERVILVCEDCSSLYVGRATSKGIISFGWRPLATPPITRDNRVDSRQWQPMETSDRMTADDRPRVARYV